MNSCRHISNDDTTALDVLELPSETFVIVGGVVLTDRLAKSTPERLESKIEILDKLYRDLPSTLRQIREGREGLMAVSFAAIGCQDFNGLLLVIQGGVDPIVYPNTTMGIVDEAARIVPLAHIEQHLLPAVTHASAMYIGQYLCLDWIAARSAGQPTQGGLHRYTAELIEPITSQ